MDGLQVVLDEPRLRVGRWRKVHMVAFPTEVDVDTLLTANGYHRDMRRIHGDTTAIFTIAKNGLTLPTEEVRAASTELLRTVSPHTVCACTVLEGQGFWAAAARAAVNGMMLATRAGSPQKIVGTVDDGAHWVGAKMQLTADEADALADAMRELHAPLW